MHVVQIFNESFEAKKDQEGTQQENPQQPQDGPAQIVGIPTLHDDGGPMWEEAHNIEDEEGNYDEFVDLQPPLEEIEDDRQITVDFLLEIILGTSEDVRPIFISILLSEEDREQYKLLLEEFRGYFA